MVADWSGVPDRALWSQADATHGTVAYATTAETAQTGGNRGGRRAGESAFSSVKSSAARLTKNFSDSALPKCGAPIRATSFVWGAQQSQKIQILLLYHQLRVLERQTARPRFEPGSGYSLFEPKWAALATSALRTA